METLLLRNEVIKQKRQELVNTVCFSSSAAPLANLVCLYVEGGMFHFKLHSSQSEYFTHALEMTEWRAIAPAQGRNKSDTRIFLCVKNHQGPPRLATIGSPVHCYIRPMGPPWGDWKHEKIAWRQNQNVPVKARYRWDIRPYPVDPDFVENNEDVACAAFLDDFWPRLEHAGHRTLVQSGIFTDSQLDGWAGGMLKTKIKTRSTT
jgi:hypothetical protein